jgi:hypothetical protein
LKKLRATVRSLEEEISTLEASQTALVAELEAADTYLEPGRPQALNRELARVLNRLGEANQEWESAASKLASLGES